MCGGGSTIICNLHRCSRCCGTRGVTDRCGLGVRYILKNSTRATFTFTGEGGYGIVASTSISGVGGCSIPCVGSTSLAISLRNAIIMGCGDNIFATSSGNARVILSSRTLGGSTRCSYICIVGGGNYIREDIGG